MDVASRSFYDGLRKYEVEPRKRQPERKPTEVFLSLEDPLNPRVIAVATPRNDGVGRTIRYPESQRHPSPSGSHKASHQSHQRSALPTSLESEWPDLPRPASSTSGLRSPMYAAHEWGPIPSRTDATEIAHADSALFMQRISHDDAPLSSTHAHQQLRVARPTGTGRTGQRKLDQWRRAKASNRTSEANILTHGAASRHWSEEGQYSPQFVANSRSTSVVSSVSADSHQRFAASSSRVRDEHRPAWVNPVDSSATQTDFPTVDQRPPVPGGILDNGVGAGVISGMAADDLPRSDGWNRFLVSPTPNHVGHRSADATTTATTGSFNVLASIATQPTPIVRVRDVRTFNDQHESLESSRAATPAEPTAHHTIVTQPTTDDAMWMLKAFQEQQEDMYRIIAEQQAQIAQLTSNQVAQSSQAPPSSVSQSQPLEKAESHLSETRESTAAAAKFAEQPLRPAPLLATNKDAVDAHGTMHHQLSTLTSASPPTSPRSPASDRHTQTTNMSQSVLLRRMTKSGPETDDDFLTTEDLDRKRELKALHNMMELDRHTHHALDARREVETAALAQRRELSERLTRHLALQRKSQHVTSSQVSSWSRSSSRSMREVGVGGDSVYSPPTPPLPRAVPMMSVLTSTELLRVENATTMTERTSANATPLSVTSSTAPQPQQHVTHPPHVTGTASNRSTPVPTHFQQHVAFHEEPRPPHGAALETHPPRQHIESDAASSRGASTQTSRASQQLPLRTHNPMEAFEALRSRYALARERHTVGDATQQPTFHSSQSLDHSWRRV